MEVDAIEDGSIEKFCETYWEVAVRIAKRNEMKKKAAKERKEQVNTIVDAAERDESTHEKATESDWEIVDGVKEVNESVSKIDMVA